MPENWTPGPWGACKGGKCSCKEVWCAEHPVASVTHGEWGDTYPSIRLTRGDGMVPGVEAFMEMNIYGEIDDETATANAQLIRTAPDLYAALKRSTEILRRVCAGEPQVEENERLMAIARGEQPDKHDLRMEELSARSEEISDRRRHALPSDLNTRPSSPKASDQC